MERVEFVGFEVMFSLDDDCCRAPIDERRDNGRVLDFWHVLNAHCRSIECVAEEFSHNFCKVTTSSPACGDEIQDDCYPIPMKIYGKFMRKFWAVVALLVMISMLASMTMFGY